MSVLVLSGAFIRTSTLVGAVASRVERLRATVADMDIQLDFCQNNLDVSQEWKLCTSKMLASQDPCIKDLIANTTDYPKTPFKGSYSLVPTEELAQGRCSGRCCSQ